MRGGREEDGKVISPMFPRLRVSDADKGGPRAPPRNKMALYEQLTVPSKRFKPSSVPTFPPPLEVDYQVVHSALFPSQNRGRKRNTTSSYYSSPQVHSRTPEKVTLHPFDEKTSSVRRHGSDKEKTERHTHGSGNDSIYLKPSSRDLACAANSHGCEDDEFSVPGCIRSENGTPRRNLAMVEQNLRLVNDQEIISLRPVITDSNLNESEKYLEKNCNENVSTKEQNKKRTSHIRSEERSLETCNVRKESYNEESSKLATVNEQTSHSNRIKPRQGSYLDVNLTQRRRSTDTDVGENRDTSSLGPKVTNDNSSPVTEVSDTSTLDSDSGLSLSPDDVVGVIGPKHFWKARRAIVNQQRIFAVQVFELHRLIKVQKLIAASPALLMEDNPLLRGSFRIHLKNGFSKEKERTQSQNAKRKDDLQNNDNSVHSENTQNTLPVLTQDVNPNKEPVDQVLKDDGPSPIIPTSMPMISQNHPSPQSFQPANNQWLIPVMSPSEGLVYKPYMGPSPPLPGFLAPAYPGGHGPLAMPPISGCLTNAAYGIPASYPQIFSEYRPSLTHGNPTVASPHYLQVPHVHPLENTRIPSFPYDNKIHPLKESELRGNATNIANVRPQNPHHFAPVSSVDQALNSSGSTAVIKVVPLTASCATESAARIFQSIQKERQQHE